MKQKRIYLDHAAATPLDERVALLIQKTASEIFGNPSSIHKEGIEAKKVVETVKKEIAHILSAQPDEIIFTSGGTESNNLAIHSVLNHVRTSDVRTWGNDKKPHIIVSAIEHPSVLEAARASGCEITFLPVSENGIVSSKEVKEAIKENTVLVSVMYANNEIGTIQPIKEIAKVIRNLKTYKLANLPLFHTDACQATNYLDMDVLRLGVDLMTWNASKIYGPKGTGALFVKRGVKLTPQMYGGGQERGFRSGTENVAGIAGFAEAMKLTEKMKKDESSRLTELRDFFIQEILTKIPNTILNGERKKCLPNNANISFLGADAEQIVIELDAKGIAASTGSACANLSKEGKVSHVISALTQGSPVQIHRTTLCKEDTVRAVGAVRFTFGRGTTREDLERTISELIKIAEKIRKQN